jgi:hypothetical protein
MTQKDIKDIKIGTTDVNRLLYRFWEVWPNLTTEHQKEWPFIVFTNFSTTDWADISFKISEIEQYGNGDLPNIEFSTDGINWNPVERNINYSYAINPYGKDLTKEIRNIYGDYAPVANYLYFRGTNNISVDGLWIEVDQYEYKKWNGGIPTYIRGYAEIHCFGNIMSLLDHSNIPTEIVSDYCFAGLFRNLMNGLVEDQALKTANILYATNVTKGCYQGLFSRNTGLKVAPKLPATNIATNCYKGMFYECLSLTTAPDLPATTLSESCYEEMFAGCDSLVKAPELPAQTLATKCYYHMFRGCDSLTTAPELPATTLYESCYEEMFAGCPITTAPQLPATNIATNCYKGMFYACTSLVTAPELPATTLYKMCYREMFHGCTSLVTAPELPATTLADYCYYSMFYDCDSLVKAPVLPALKLTPSCYANMFSGCDSLQYVKMMATNVSATNCLFYWLDKVNTTSGTFVKNKAATWDFPQYAEIPSGWTITKE